MTPREAELEERCRGLENELKRYKMHPIEADPREVVKAMNLIEWNRQIREELAACKLALEEARPLLKLIAIAQPSRGHEAALDLVEAALNWRTTEHVEGAGPGGGPPAAGSASPAPDKPGTGDPLWPGPGQSPGKPGRAGAPGSAE